MSILVNQFMFFFDRIHSLEKKCIELKISKLLGGRKVYNFSILYCWC